MKSKIYLWLKTIHRIFMYATTFLVIIMSGTGTILKFPLKFRSLDLAYIRFLHNELSIYFTISLFLMMISGIYMYIFTFPKKY
jgi:hypothetical protein